jgi:hypothetical protein
MTDESKTPYHDHLDVCAHCAAHPFDLCPAGAKALHEEATHRAVDSLNVRAESEANDDH